jgi:hypothetical protein
MTDDIFLAEILGHKLLPGAAALSGGMTGSTGVTSVFGLGDINPCQNSPARCVVDSLDVRRPDYLNPCAATWSERIGGRHHAGVAVSATQCWIISVLPTISKLMDMRAPSSVQVTMQLMWSGVEQLC